MAATGTPTPNIGLRCAQGTDPASVDDINYNSNLLDTKLGAVGNDSVQDQLDSLKSKIVSYDLGMSETLPSLVPPGLVGFGISSSVTVGGNSIPAGTRFFGYVAASIGHFVGVANGNALYMIRKDSNGWSYLATK